MLQGDIPAVNALLKIMERRAKLLGLDQPFKQQIEVTTYDGDTIDSEVRRLAELLRNVDSSPSGEVALPTGQTQPNTQ